MKTKQLSLPLSAIVLASSLSCATVPEKQIPKTYEVQEAVRETRFFKENPDYYKLHHLNPDQLSRLKRDLVNIVTKEGGYALGVHLYFDHGNNGYDPSDRDVGVWTLEDYVRRVVPYLNQKLEKKHE